MSMLPFDIHRRLDPQPVDTQVDRTIRINGKMFRCECGCNVFRHPSAWQGDHYKCNACGTIYEAE